MTNGRHCSRAMQIHVKESKKELLAIVVFIYISGTHFKQYTLNVGGDAKSPSKTSTFLQKFTEPAISHPVGDLCQHFTKLTGPCAYTLHSNPIPLNRWYKWPFVTCRIHFTNRLPTFPNMFLSSCCEEF